MLVNFGLRQKEAVKDEIDKKEKLFFNFKENG